MPDFSAFRPDPRTRRTPNLYGDAALYGSSSSRSSNRGISSSINQQLAQQGSISNADADMWNARQKLEEIGLARKQQLAEAKAAAKAASKTTTLEKQGIIAAGASVTHVQRADGTIIPIAAATGDQHLIHPKGSKYYVSPKTGQQYAPDPTSKTGLTAVESRDDIAAQKAGQKQIIADEKEAIKDENDRREAIYTHEKRPSYTDAHGRIQPVHSDEEWKGIQKQQLEGAKKANEYLKDGRRFYTDKLTKEPVPLTSDEEHARNKADKLAKIQKDAAERPHKQRLDVLKAELSNPDLKVSDKDLKDADEALTAASAPLMALRGNDDFATPITDVELRDMLKDADPAKKAAANAYLNARENVGNLAKAEAQRKALEQEVYKTNLRIAEPDKYAEELKAEAPAKSAEDLKAHATEIKERIKARAAEHKAEAERIKAKDDELSAQHALTKARYDQALAKAESPAVIGTLGDSLNDLEEQMTQWESESQDQRAAVNAQAEEINKDVSNLKILGDEENRRTDERQKQHSEALDAVLPGAGKRYGDTVADVQKRAQDLRDKYPDPFAPEAKAAFDALQKDFEAKTGAIAKEADAAALANHEKKQELRMKAFEAAAASNALIKKERADNPDAPHGLGDLLSLDKWKKAFTQTSDEKSKINTAQYQKHQAIIAEQMKKAGLDPENADHRALMQDAEKMDWSNAIIASDEKGGWGGRMGAEHALKGITNMLATGKDDSTAEISRTLSDGTLLINPLLVQDDEGYAKAVEKSDAKPEAKEAALKQLPALQLQQAAAMLPALLATPKATPGESYESFANRRAEDAQHGAWFAGLSDGEKVREYFKEQKNRGNLVNVIDYLGTQGMSGIVQAGTMVAGGVGIATGWVPVLGEASSQLAGYGSKLASSMTATTRQETGAGGVLRTFGQVANMAPPLALVALSRGKLAPMLAISALQTAGSQYAQGYEEMRAKGATHEEAWKAQALPAVASGLVTAVLTYGGGNKGIEALYSSAGREAAKKAIQSYWTALPKAFIKEGGREFLFEEFPDELISTIIAAKASGDDPAKAVHGLIDSLPEFGGAIMLLGGAGGIKEAIQTKRTGDQAPAPDLEEAPAPSILPETVAARTAAIDNWTPTGSLPSSIQDAAKAAHGKEPTPEQQTDTARTAAHALVEIAAGQDPRTMSPEVRRALGIKINSKTGAIEPLSKSVTPLVDSVEDTKGNHQPVITDAARAWLAQEVPGAGEAVKLSYAERVDQIKNPPKPAKKPKAAKPAKPAAVESAPTPATTPSVEAAQQKPQPAEQEKSPRGTIDDAAPSGQSAGVPLMVTRDMRQQLYDKGYSKQQVDAMKPEAAQTILQAKASAVDAAAHETPKLPRELASASAAHQTKMSNLRKAGGDVVVVKDEVEAEKLIGSPLKQKGRRGVTTRVNGKPTVVLIESNMAGDSRPIDSLLDEELHHAAAMTVMDESPDLAAQAENEAEGMKGDVIHSDFAKLSRRGKVVEAAAAYASGKWTPGKKSRIKAFMDAVVNRIAKTLNIKPSEAKPLAVAAIRKLADEADALLTGKEQSPAAPATKPAEPDDRKTEAQGLTGGALINAAETTSQAEVSKLEGEPKKKATAARDAILAALRRYNGHLPIDLAKGDMGFAYQGGKVLVDVARAVKEIARDATSPQNAREMAQKLFDHEIIHFFAVNTVGNERIMGIWNAMPEDVRKAVQDAYSVRLVATGAPALELNEFSGGHEYFRAMVEATRTGVLSEQVLGTELAAKWKQYLADVLAFLRDLSRQFASIKSDAKRKELMGKVDAIRKEITEALDAFEKSLPVERATVPQSFVADLEMSGFAKFQGSDYKIKASGGNTFYVERTTNGTRETISSGHPDIEAARNAAIRFVEDGASSDEKGMGENQPDETAREKRGKGNTPADSNSPEPVQRTGLSLDEAKRHLTRPGQILGFDEKTFLDSQRNKTAPRVANNSPGNEPAQAASTGADVSTTGTSSESPVKGSTETVAASDGAGSLTNAKESSVKNDSAPSEGVLSVYPRAINGQDKWLVQQGEKRGFGDSIHDTEAEAIEESTREATRRAQRAQTLRDLDAQVEAEAKAKREREDLGTFTDGMSPMKKGGVVKQLTAEVNYRGTLMTRRDLIQKMVKEGRKVETEEGQRVLSNEKGEYLGEKVLTKAGIDYALHLIAEAETKSPAITPPEIKEEAPSLKSEGKFSAEDKAEFASLAEGLFQPPSAEVTYKAPIPPAKLGGFITLATKLAEREGEQRVDTPEKVAAFIDEALPGGKARALSDAFWSAIRMTNPVLPAGEVDWSAIYAPKVEPTAKEQDEAKELEITKQARMIVLNGNDPAKTYQDLVSLYESQPALTSKTSTSKINQAYSTPAPMAYLVSRMADVVGGTVIAEPSAGNGMLLIERHGNQTVEANELDPSRRARLAEQGITSTDQDATVWQPSKTPDRVVANPPFGQVMEAGGRNKVFTTPMGETTSIDHAIVLQSLATMAQDGRAAFIIGGPPPTVRTPEARAKFYRDGKAGKFFSYLYENNNVIDHFTVSGDLYKKQGAGWPLDIFVIRGKGRSANTLPGLKSPRIISSWEELSHELDRTDADRIKLNQLSAAEMQQRVDAMAGKLEGLSGSLRGDPSTSGTTGVRDGQTTSEAATPDRSGASESAGDSTNEAATGELPADPGLAGESTIPASERVESTEQPGERQQRPEQSVSDFQAPFPATSGVNPAGLLAPKNLIGPMSEAMARLKKDVGGDLVSFVREKLGYPKKTDISKYFFGDQIDALAQAIHTAENGGALVIGDQTGTGKGRIAAGLMKYCVGKGLIPVFVTKDQQLYDAMLDDLKDIDATEVVPVISNENIKEKSLKDKLADLGAQQGEDAFNTIRETGDLPGKTNAIFTSYDQIKADDATGISKSERARAKRDMEPPPDKWRMAALRAVAPRAMFILDESHLAGGQSTTGWRFGALLKLAKHAYYSSATFAKRPDNMGIYFRTNLGTVGGDINGLIELMQAGGVPAMQIGSSMLAQDGQYMRRERSYQGITFQTHINQSSYERDKMLADNYTEGLRSIIAVQERMSQAANIVNTILSAFGKKASIPVGNRARLESSNFSAKLHNLVRQYLLAIKANSAAQIAVKAIKDGIKASDGTVKRHKVIVAVENTMESIITDLNAQGLPLNYNGVLQMYLNQMKRIKVSGGAYGREAKYFEIKEEAPEAFKDTKDSELRSSLVVPAIDPETGESSFKVDEEVSSELIRRAMMDVFKEAREIINDIQLADMPLSPIDAMRQAVEREGIRTGEMTGRTTGIDKNGQVYQRTPAEVKGKLTAKNEFNNSDLDFLVINKTGSTGVSMHASDKFKDQRPRMMMVVQANLDINEFMQTLGRIHRAGQVELPLYMNLQSALPAENRPAAITGQKMSMLNANTTSNADSEVTQKDGVDIFNQYGDEVVHNYLGRNPGLTRMLAQSWQGQSGDSKLTDSNGLLYPLGDFQNAESGGEYGYLSRSVTGHLAILPVEEQEAFWEAVSADYRGLIEYLDQIGQNSLRASVLDLKAETVSSAPFTPGSDTGSVFGRPSALEIVNAKMGKEPMTADDALKIANKARTTAEKRQDVFMEASNARIEAEDKRKETTARNWSERREDWLDGQRQQRDTIANALGQIGMFGYYKRDDSSEGYAFVEDVQTNGEKLNTPSAQFAIVRVNDSQDRLKIPVSQLAQFFRPHMTTDAMRDRVAREGWERTWEYGTQQAIVTGNLMAALRKLTENGAHSRVISYTKDDGSQQMGIMLSSSVAKQLSENAENNAAVANADDAKAVMDAGYTIKNSNGNVRMAGSNGTYHLYVPESRAQGGKYWRDPGLLALTGEFNQTTKGTFAATFYDAATLTKVFDYLTSIQNDRFTRPVDSNSALGSPPTRAAIGQIIRSFERDWAPFFTYIDDTAPKEKRKAALRKIIDQFATPENSALWKQFAELSTEGLVPEDAERVKEAKELLPYLEGQTLGAPPSGYKTPDSMLAATKATMQGMNKPAAPAFQSKDLHAAYQRAIRGSSTSSASIRSVFDEAKKSQPSLSADEFKAQLKADYYAGLVGLEPSEQAASVEKAGQFTMRDSLGVVNTNMVFMPTTEAEMIDAAERDTTTTPDQILSEWAETLGQPPIDPTVANQGDTDENREHFAQSRASYIANEITQADFNAIRDKVEAQLDEDEAGMLDIIQGKVADDEELSIEEEVARRMLANRLRTRGLRDSDTALVTLADSLWGQDIRDATETARKLAIRVDQLQTPQERLDAAMGRIIAPNRAKLRERLTNVWTPSAKRREIARLEAEKAEAQTDASRARLEKTLAEAKARMDQNEIIDKMAAENREAVDKVLTRLGLTQADLSMTPDDRHSLQVGIMDSAIVKAHMVNLSPEVQKAIEMSVRGYADSAIVRDTGLSNDVVGRVTEHFRNEVAKKAVSQMVKVGKHTMGSIIEGGKNLIKWILGAPPAPLQGMVNSGVKNAANVQAQVQAILNAAIPTRRNRNRRALHAAVVNGKKGQKITVFVPYDPTDWQQVYRVARELSTREATAMSKVYEYWINGILSGPQTHVVNTSSNLLSTAWHYGPQWFASASVNTILRDPNSTQWGEFPRVWAGFLKGIAPAMKNFALAWSTEADPIEYQYLDRPVTVMFNDAAMEKAGGGRSPAIGGPAGRVIRTPGRFLVAMDAFAKTLIMHGEVSAQAYRSAKRQNLSGVALENYMAKQIATPGSQAWEAMLANGTLDTSSWEGALQVAKELTFQDENDITKTVEKLANAAKQAKYVGLLAKFLFPFVRTPTNIYRTGMRKAGGSAGILLWRLGRAGFYTMKEGRPFFDTYAKGKMVQDASESVMAGLLWFGLMAIAEGDPEDEDRWITMTGTRPYGIANAGERTAQLEGEGGSNLIIIRKNPVTGAKLDKPIRIAYGRYEPLALTMGSIIDAAREFKEWTRLPAGDQTAGKLAGTIASHLASQAQDKTFLQGVSGIMDFFDKLTSGRYEPGQEAAKFLINGAIPNLIRQPLRMSGPEILDSHKAHEILGSANIGNALADGEAKITTAGKPVTREGNKYLNVLFPGTTEPGKATFYAALKDWNTRHPGEKWNPDPITKGDWYIYDPAKGGTKGKFPLKDVRQISLFEKMVGNLFASKSAQALGKLGYRPGMKATPDMLDAVKKSHTDAIKQVRSMPPSAFIVKAKP